MEAKISYVLLVILLFAASVSDTHTGKIPNRITFPGTMAGLLFAIQRHLLFDRLLSVGLILLLSYLAFRHIRNGIGMGDMKLWMMAGAFIGFRCSFLAFSLGQVLLLIYVLLCGKGRSVLFGLLYYRFTGEVPDGTKGYPFSLFYLIGTSVILLFMMGGLL